MKWVTIQETKYNLEVCRKVKSSGNNIIIEFTNGDITIIYNITKEEKENLWKYIQ